MRLALLLFFFCEVAQAGTKSSTTAPPAGALEATARSDRPLGERPGKDEAPGMVRARVDLEYRAGFQSSTPLSLNDLTAENVRFFDQRLRLDSRAAFGAHVSFRVVADLLDGVLFGDNGSFQGEPLKSRGSFIGTKSPNLATLTVDRLDPDGSSLDRDNYGYTLAPAEPLVLRAAYGEARLPFGLVRAGRQPLTEGRGVFINDGMTPNRWGVSRSMDTLDAFVFGTKLSAIVDSVGGREVDRSEKRGVFLGVLYGLPVTGMASPADDLTQVATTIYYAHDSLEALGAKTKQLKAGIVGAYRFGEIFDTDLATITPFVEWTTDRFRLSAQHVQMLGGTREISESLRLLNEQAGPPEKQAFRGYGGFVELAWLLSNLELILEVDYAAGDDDPSNEASLDQLTFTADTNVGLHLFENVLAYASARSARMGVVNLAALDPPTVAVSEVDTRGGVTNAIVIFPQIVTRPLEALSLRAGVMFAFAERRTVDPVQSTLGKDGSTIEDDLVGFNGGAPGSYWGTEIDLGLTWTPLQGFDVDVEAAYLFPGDALNDENGDASSSAFVAGRLTYHGSIGAL
ncbi:MAG: hypothetical protein HYV07_01235 [Deltaproteobacteria bacterium]|nr:hypothetical protein [Deltaproteobacteria bacterium]